MEPQGNQLNWEDVAHIFGRYHIEKDREVKQYCTEYTSENWQK